MDMVFKKGVVFTAALISDAEFYTSSYIVLLICYIPLPYMHRDSLKNNTIAQNVHHNIATHCS